MDESKNASVMDPIKTASILGRDSGSGFTSFFVFRSTGHFDDFIDDFWRHACPRLLCLASDRRIEGIAAKSGFYTIQ